MKSRDIVSKTNVEPIKQLDEPVLQSISRFVFETDFESIPKEVIHQARLSVLDTLGCVISGYALPEAKQAIEVEKEIDGKQQATIIGAGDRVSMAGAARVNGYMGDILEFNDLIYGHSGIGIIPTSLAVAESLNSSGKEVLTSIVLGYEVSGRIYQAYYDYKKDYHDCCVVAVGIPNSFGAAACAARLFCLDADATFHAMNIAGTLTGMCPAESLEKGGTAKPYMFGGWPAHVGIYSALCAKSGITGTSSILEGKMGLLSTVANTFDLTPLVDGLGQTWALEKPRRKAHACCGYTHAPIDGTLAIMEDHGITIEEIERMDISMAPYTMDLVGGERPPDALASKFSTRYVVSVAMRKMSGIMPEDTLEEEYHKHIASGIEQLMERIHIKSEPSYAHYSNCSVKICTRDGRRYAKEVEHPKGDPENPLTESEIEEKFRRLVSPVFGKAHCDKIINEIYGLDQKNTIEGLVKLLVVA